MTPIILIILWWGTFLATLGAAWLHDRNARAVESTRVGWELRERALLDAYHLPPIGQRRGECPHQSAVEVLTDNDLDRGTLVAWWCAKCETQLPAEWQPTLFQGEIARRGHRHELDNAPEFGIAVVRPGSAEWRAVTGMDL